MKKSGPLTLLALAAVLLFVWGCRKEENVSTDTAVTDTGITSTSTTETAAATTDTAGTTGTMGTMGTMMGTSGSGMMSTSGTMGMPAPMTTQDTAKGPGKKGSKK